jgi:hypothetical protein
VKAAGGEAVGILFDDKGGGADTRDDALLFFDRGALSYGGTDFGFLADAWWRWPGHFIGIEIFARAGRARVLARRRLAARGATRVLSLY